MAGERILVVEDERIVFAEMRHLLDEMGFEICGWAKSGEEALELASREEPDLVLMDIMLSGSMDGVQAAERVTSDFSLPVVFVTAHTAGEMLARITGTSPYGIVHKPLEPQSLRSAIALALHAHSVKRALTREVSVTRALAALAETILTTEDVDEVSRAVLEQALAVTGSRMGWAGYLDARSGQLVCPAVLGRPEGDEGGVAAAFESLADVREWVVENRSSAIMDSLDDAAGLLGDEWPSGKHEFRHESRPGPGRVVAVPVMAAGRMVGQLGVEGASSPYSEEDGAFLERVAVLYSLALQQRRTRQSLFESENRCSLLMEQASDGILLLGAEGGMLEVNARACEMTGFSRTELLEMRFTDLIPDGGLWEQALRIESLSAGEPVMVERRFRRADGRIIEVEVSAKKLRGGLYQAIFRDISSRKQVEREVLSIAKFPEEAPSPVLRVSHSGIILYANHAADELLRWWKTDPGWPLPGDIFEQVGRILKSGRPGEMEVETDQKVYSLTVAPIRGEDYANIYGLDITERKRSQDEYIRLATAVDQASEAVIITDSDGRIIYVNAAFESLSGYGAQEISDRPILELDVAEEDRAAVEACERKVAAGRVWSGRQGRRRKDGTLVRVEASAFPIRDLDGRTVSHARIWRDVTREELLETELRHSQKMEAVGTLAGGIAHDFNNILAAVIGFAEMAQIRAGDEDFVRHNLDQVLKACARARDLVRHILSFCRKGEPRRQSVRLCDVVSDSLRMLRASLPSTISIVKSLECGTGMILADPIQLHQIVMNLGTNAAHAMRQKGGELRITVELGRIGVGDAAFPEAAPGEYMQLTVRDSGEGMVREVMERIFDPFFTTKPAGEGTGMGLSVTHGIVRRHGGHISVSSVPGESTTFRIILPAVKASAADGESRADEQRRGTGRVLVVDDEPAVARALTQMLTELGYEAESVEGGEEALRAVRENPGRYDCLVTDQTMPGMTGLALSREVRRVRDAMPVVLCTGYADSVDSPALCVENVNAFLQKPVFLGDLAAALRKALNDAKPDGTDGQSAYH